MQYQQERVENHYQTELYSITNDLLMQELHYGKIREAAISLKKLFYEAAGFEESSSMVHKDIWTENGQAVSAWTAAFCIDDFLRTRNFILGIKEAIEQKLRASPDRPVIILYAGTGPFATLFMPLTMFFSPQQMQWWLLEINPTSIAYLQQTIQQFNVKSYIIDVLETDATNFVIPPNCQPAIVVSETLKPGLLKEQQVSIVANLMAQCAYNTILIPKLITVDACLANGSITNAANDIILLQTLIQLDANLARAIHLNPTELSVLNEGIQLMIPELAAEKNYRLFLRTQIKIFGEHVLGFNESGLTIPHFIKFSLDDKKYPLQLIARYQLSNQPDFLLEEVENIRNSETSNV